jgi:heat shock protein HslJ
MPFRRLALALPLCGLIAGCMTPAPAGSTLAGTDWRFTTIDGKLPVAEATLSFGDDRLAANAGCNRMGGAWRSEGAKLIAGPLAATKMACDGRMDQERAVSELLNASPEFALAGTRLTLRTTTHWAELARK